MDLVVGTALFGLNYGLSEKKNRVNDKTLRALLDFCEENSIYCLDTSPGYGDAEDRIASYLRDKKNNSILPFRIITKTPSFGENDSYQKIYNSFRASAESFKEKLPENTRLDLLCHKPDGLIGANRNDVYSVLNKLRSEGLVDRIGISVYTMEQITGFEKDWVLDLVQLPINIVDQRFERSLLVRDLRAKGTEIHARSIFLQGLLLKAVSELPEYFLVGRRFDVLKRFEDFVQCQKVTKLFACLNYALHADYIDKIIVGVHSKSELENIVAIANLNDFQVALRFEDFKYDLPDLVDPLNWKV